jgi:hypothetical protein
MSTDYRTLKKVSARELFGGRLKEYGIREHINPTKGPAVGDASPTGLTTCGRL